MPYAVVKKEQGTGRIDVVIARGMLFHHADQLAADLWPRCQDGFYIKAVNENELEDPQENAHIPTS